MREPVWPDYLADPFVLPVPGGFAAYGTRPAGLDDGTAFEALLSPDLRRWRRAGRALPISPSIGTDYWAPEVVADGGGWWMLYSAGRGIAGHHLRVARADAPTGPFRDLGVNLSPDESFAIDPHPFVDAEGRRWLFFARDVLDAVRPGTHLAVRPMHSWTKPAGPAVPVLAPDADWQLYQAQREMYGRRTDWYTLEGPTVVRRPEGLVLLFSGGSWEGPGYGVASATANRPEGPWTVQTPGRADVLSTAITGQLGPGHCSVVALPDGGTAIAYHAWDGSQQRRRMHVAALRWEGRTPRVEPDGALLPAPAATGS